MIGCTIAAAFQICFMALAVNVIDKCGSSNKCVAGCYQRRLRKGFAVYIATKYILATVPGQVIKPGIKTETK